MSEETYRGHLSVPTRDIATGSAIGNPGNLRTTVVAGPNPFQKTSLVYDVKSEEVRSAPFFERAHAGAELKSSPGSLHMVLIDKDDGAWTTGSNSKGQLLDEAAAGRAVHASFF